MGGLSRPGFLALIAVNVLFFWSVAGLGGWAGFGLVVAGVVALCLGALRWGADSRDGANWNNRRSLGPGGRTTFDEGFVDDQIKRLERQFPRHTN
ncbi:MAG: hypothetical protein ACRDJL_12720 [Actinomycetota bacterium]